MVDMVHEIKPLELTDEEKMKQEILKLMPKKKKPIIEEMLDNITENYADLNFSITSHNTLIVEGNIRF